MGWWRACRRACRGKLPPAGVFSMVKASQVPLRAARTVVAVLGLAFAGCRQFPETAVTNDLEARGRDIFRDDTFGDERFWTDTARLHEIVAREIQPLEALGLGVKVDM